VVRCRPHHQDSPLTRVGTRENPTRTLIADLSFLRSPTNIAFEMPDEIRSSTPPTQLAPGHLPLDRNAIIAMILGLLTAAAILLFIYQVKRASELKVEAAEVWADYQIRIAKATVEEDPNLKQQYTEEQDVLRRHATELKDMSNSARYAAKFSGFAALFVLLGTAAAVAAFLSKSNYIGYAGILLALIGIGFEIKVLL